jgi:hypothetical protein
MSSGPLPTSWREAWASSRNRCLEGQRADNAPTPLPSKGDGHGRSSAPCCGCGWGRPLECRPQFGLPGCEGTVRARPNAGRAAPRLRGKPGAAHLISECACEFLGDAALARRCLHHGSTIRLRMAYRTRAAEDDKLSLRMMAARCVSTVLRLMLRMLAICLLV